MKVLASSFFCRQEALLAAISEKDANIALLELSSSKKKTQEEVAALKREKDRLVQQLKQQVQLMAGGLWRRVPGASPTHSPPTSLPARIVRSCVSGLAPDIYI